VRDSAQDQRRLARHFLTWQIKPAYSMTPDELLERPRRRAAEELAIYSRLTLEEAVLFLSQSLLAGSLTDSGSIGKPGNAAQVPGGKREG